VRCGPLMWTPRRAPGPQPAQWPSPKNTPTTPHRTDVGGNDAGPGESSPDPAEDSALLGLNRTLRFEEDRCH
jgi:hypothetical protein